MYSDLPTVDHTVDRAGYVLVDGKRVLNAPGVHLKYQSCTLLTCQRCGRQAIAHPLRVVSEESPYGRRYFHALVPEVAPAELCGDCFERECKEAR